MPKEIFVDLAIEIRSDSSVGYIEFAIFYTIRLDIPYQDPYQTIEFSYDRFWQWQLIQRVYRNNTKTVKWLDRSRQSSSSERSNSNDTAANQWPASQASGNSTSLAGISLFQQETTKESVAPTSVESRASLSARSFFTRVSRKLRGR